jgi:uncharacterized membrane protein
MWAAWAVIALSVVGLAINLYFVTLFYRVPAWFGRALGGAARACGIDGGSCKRVVATPYARLFADRPNVVIGIPWSLLVIVSGVLCLVTGTFPLWLPCLLIGLASIVVGAYLTYALFFVLKEPCPL